jgi:hypothetical protein
MSAVLDGQAGIGGNPAVKSATPLDNGHDDHEGMWTARAIAFWSKLTSERIAFCGSLWTSPAAQHSERVLDIVRFTHAKGLALADLLSMATWDNGFGMPKYRDFHLMCATEQWEVFEKQDNERREFAATLYDPWADLPPPDWPGGTFDPAYEATIATLALRDGLDYGALSMAYLCAVSGAADKSARFEPFQHHGFDVPPVIYGMPIADSGFKKTQLGKHAFAAIRRRDRQQQQDYQAALDEWEASEEKGSKPKEPPPVIMSDANVEKMQAMLTRSPRGALILRDEIAPLFDFKRYTKGGLGAANRAFYLEAYDGMTVRVHRMSRDTDHGDVAITLFGCCQPDRLASFGDLGEDGLLQRIIPLVLGERRLSNPSVTVNGQDKIDHAIELLLTERGHPVYRTTEEGSALIRETEVFAFDLADMTDYGKAFAGFCAKLHGLHARLAFLLHLFDGKHQEPTIPAETVRRAGRLAKFCMLHARAFHSRAPGSLLEITKSAASLILSRKPPSGPEPERVLASTFTGGVRICRGMSPKRLGEVLAPLIAGGWLDPETPYPDCNAWFVTLGLRQAFSQRRQTELERKQLIRDRIAEAAAEVRASRAA